MANIFAIITAVLLAASAFLAFKNQQAYESEITERKGAESRLDTSRALLARLISERNDTESERKGVEEDTLVQRDKEEKQRTTNADLQDQIDTKRTSVESNERKIAEIEEQTKELGEISELAAKIRRMKSEITGLEDEKAQNEALLANLLSEKSSTENTIENYEDINEAMTNKKSYFSSARISAIYGPWGFVTLSAGNASGVVAGSTLDVVRSGETVAKLRVRSVEANRASADIVPDSTTEDTVLMVGDRVQPSAGKEPKKKAEPKAEAKEEAVLDELSVD